MDMRKKLISIVGALALTVGMTAGIVSAQETVSTSDGVGITFVVACSTANAGTSSASIGASDSTADSVAFPRYDAGSAEQTGTVSTDENAFRVNINLSCLAQSNFSLTANITDFSTDDDPSLSFPGSKFQLSSTGVWTVTGTADSAVDNVSEPASPVEFTGAGPTYTSSAIAQTTAPTTASSMYMDFTGQVVGLDQSIAAGDYSAEITVTLNTGTAP